MNQVIVAAILERGLLMIYHRKANDRGHVQIGWLNSFHTFSFGEYYDPRFMQFRDLRVINHDFIQGMSGFPTHPHKDMEIITYVLNGAVEHQDSLGNREQIQAGEIQVMSAGTGIRHSEYNPINQELELLQIWIMPDSKNHKPRYEQKKFSKLEKLNQWKLIVQPSPEQLLSHQTDQANKSDALWIHQDLFLYSSILESNQKLKFQVREGRHIWIQIANGHGQLEVTHLVTSDDQNKSTETVSIEKGDGIAMSSVCHFELTANTEIEILLFDLR